MCFPCVGLRRDSCWCRNILRPRNRSAIGNSAMSKAWPESDLERLKFMWIEVGSSAAQIAAELGKTRNAVLGIVHRSKDIPGRVSTVARSRAQTRLPAPRKVRVPPENIIPLLQLKPADPPIYTIDLRDAHCHWPYDAPDAPDHGGYRYCGLARSTTSCYCDNHNVVAFQVDSKKAVSDVR